MIPALATLIMGLILGYVAQRSRICFIGGLRDFILVRDRELLKGAITFFATAWLLFSIAGALHMVDWQTPGFESSTGLQGTAAVTAAEAAAEAGGQGGGDVQLLLLAGGAGLVVGLFSTLANGCPTRQHVLAAQGVRDSLWYLGGFYLGIAVYYLVTKPLLALLL